MIGHIEWKSRESTDTEYASIVRCVGEHGLYNIEFSDIELGSEGRLAIQRGQKGEQHIKGMYMFTNGVYKGEADVVGRLTTHDGIVTFTGLWHDPTDKTGEWDVYIEFNEPEHLFTFSQDDARPMSA